MLKKVVWIVGLLFAGFCGGAMAPWVVGWFRAATVVAPADAVAIANTYIVFTTLIFVGVTVLLAVAGYVFTQHFSATKHSQEREILDELKDRISTDEQLGVKLANAMLENSDVKRHLRRVLFIKVQELIQAQAAEAQATAAAYSKAAKQADDFSAQIYNDVNGGSNGNY